MKVAPYLLFLLMLCSCGFPEQKESVSYEQDSVKLQVAVDYNLARYSDHNPIFATVQTGILSGSSPHIIAARLDTVFEDSVKTQVVSVYTGLPRKAISVTIFSLLTNDLQKTIDLQSDTIISFSGLHCQSFLKGDTNDLLNLPSTDPDTIFIGHSVSGCFSDSKEKITLMNSGEGYRVSYREDNNLLNSFETTVSNGLFNSSFHSFILKSNRLSNTCFSTTSSCIYIRERNNIYAFPIVYSCDGNDWNEAYNTFKKSIGITTIHHDN